MQRLFWVSFGVVAHLLFVATLPFLFLLLYRGGGDLLSVEPAWISLAPFGPPRGMALDLLLLAQFGLLHSLFLIPEVRQRLQVWVPPELYGCVFTVISSLALLTTALLWHPLPGVIYAMSGLAARLFLAAFLASWVALVYTMSLTGLGFQTGLTHWWSYVRRQPVPTRHLVATGIYGQLRHPIYLWFLGLIWFTPRLTTDHLLLGCVWTGYIYIGSVLKDRRLLFHLGDSYREYMARVPGYPLILWGPLARQNCPAMTSRSVFRQNVQERSLYPPTSGGNETDRFKERA